MAFGLDDALSFGGSLLSGFLNNSAASSRQDDAQSFSAQQFATRYQVTTADMAKAGLNPMLAYTNGVGSAPTSSAASSSGYSDFGQVLNQSKVANAQVANTAADTENKKAQTSNIEADTSLKRAQTYLTTAQEGLAGASADQARSNIGYLESQAKRISLELSNIPKEGNRLDALVRNLGAEYDNILERTKNTVQATEQVKWLAVKTMLESDLTGLDVNAAKSLEGVGSYGRQLKPVIDIIRSIIRK